EQLFSENKKKEANPDAHPYSENLHVPKKRSLTKQEIKERTAKSYKKLAEVVQKKKQEKTQEDYALNRLKAKVFNRRIQRHVLKKSATLR
uniref:ALMS motif domain-containing protein n=2 Tax=Magallana gigas TaxID=29159 RepID=A0A8W8J2Q1_MAGGI